MTRITLYDCAQGNTLWQFCAVLRYFVLFPLDLLRLQRRSSFTRALSE